MTPDTLILPRCGITLADIERIAGETDNIKEASRKLGVDHIYLVKTLHRKGLRHLFPEKPRIRGAGSLMGLTKEDVEAAVNSGLIMPDVADYLGCSLTRVFAMKKHFNIPTIRNSGKAARIAAKGYCSHDELERKAVRP